MSSTLSADDLARLSQAVETVLKELNGICRDEDSCKSRLSGLRQKLDLPPNIDFIEDYKTYKSLCRQMHEIEGLSEKKETAKKRVFKSAEGLVPLLKDMGVDIMPDDLTLVKVAEWDVQFRQKKRNYERYDEIIKTDIPKIKLLSQDEYVKKIECLNDVNRDIKALLEKHPEFEQLTVSKTAEEYRKEEKMAMNGTTEVTEDKRKLLREVEGVLKEYRERYPTLEEELNMLESKRERLIDFKDAVEKAKKVMEEVSGAVNKQWASDLNIKVNEKLKHLNPQYELSFDTNLSFTIKPKAGTGTPLGKESLSTGALDQIYLAVRLSISEHLSSKVGKLPIILDEPFANTDDERFKSGMGYLVNELSKHHQVIILTCHKQRHEWLKAEMPTLFDNIETVNLKCQDT